MAPDNGDDLDLEGAIGAALDGQLDDARQKPDEPFPRSDEAQAKDDEPAEYVRDGRRFVRKGGKETDVGAAEAPAVAAAKEWKPLWYKEEYGDWSKLPEGLRKDLERRETESAQAITKHSTAAKAWEPVSKMIEPHVQQLAAAGVSPQQYVTNLINADAYLRSKPEEALNWLCKSITGMDIIDLANRLDEQGYQPQRVDPLEQELATLRQRVEEMSQMPARQEREAIGKTIAAWSQDKPHWQDVQHLAIGIIQADPSVRERFRVSPQATLDKLYEQAMWAHPELRERILADQRKSEVKRARENSLGTREQSHANGQARSTPKLSIEDEISGLIDGMI